MDSLEPTQHKRYKLVDENDKEVGEVDDGLKVTTFGSKRKIQHLGRVEINPAVAKKRKKKDNKPE